MPVIPQDVLNSVFYLYESEKDALAGENPGGTGFIVVYDASLYAVTNWHVAVDHEHPICPVIRLNKSDGGIDVLDLGPEDWEFIPGKDDIAIYPLDLERGVHQIAAIPIHMFAMPEMQRHASTQPAIGVGEDAFMIGLFVDHAGLTTNIPSARFGNVSMLPNPRALIEQPTGFRGESYIVDMHSRTGFSGSPVFVYRTFAAMIQDKIEVKGFTIHGNAMRPVNRERFYDLDVSFRTDSMFKLLGIHWAQFPETWEIASKKALSEARKKHLVADGASVEGMSGMTCVIPAWKIKEMLDMPKFKQPRAAKLEEFKQQYLRQPPKPEISARDASPPATDGNPTHREDFNRLLGAAARKREQED